MNYKHEITVAQGNNYIIVPESRIGHTIMLECGSYENGKRLVLGEGDLEHRLVTYVTNYLSHLWLSTEPWSS